MEEKGKLFVSKIEQKTKAYPDTLDFRKEGKVTHVKNQNPCNSCPIFSSIAAIEAQYKNKVGVLESFSEQQLLDCMDYHTKCESFIVWMQLFKYYGNLKYLFKEDFYKYKVRDNKKNCKSFEHAKKSGKNEAIRLNGVEFQEYNNGGQKIPVYDIKRALNEIQGPVVVLFDAALILDHYVGGIIKTNPEKCSKGAEQNHAVVIVGYGVDTDKSEYWIVKNSYGEDWGESGYFRVLAGENLCLIENVLLFPDIISLNFYDWCQIEGCIKCSSSDSCSQCGMGYYLSGKTCKKCKDNCQECGNANDCKQCDKWGGYFPGNNVCYKCPNEYDLCEGNLEFCKDNYYLDPNTNKDCKKSSITNCQYSVINNNKEICLMCDDGYGLPLNGEKTQCTKCRIDNCRTCSFYNGQELCEKCKDGYSESSLSNPPYSSCSKCKEGCNYCLDSNSNYKDEDGICFNCPENCEKCELSFKTDFYIKCFEAPSDKSTDNSSEFLKTFIAIFILLLF